MASVAWDGVLPPSPVCRSGISLRASGGPALGALLGTATRDGDASGGRAAGPGRVSGRSREQPTSAAMSAAMSARAPDFARAFISALL